MKKKTICIIAIIIVVIVLLEIKKTENNNKENQNTVNTQSVEITNETQNELNNELNLNENQITKDNNINEEEQKNEEKISKKLAPSGFMGASLYKVYLYNNGDTYVITFDGDGYEEKNIVDKKLIAKNVEAIEISDSDEDQGMVIVKGGEKINEDFGWIDFK